MADRIQVRRDTAANWTSADPTLTQGEIGYETDTDKVKIGDGTTAWTSLGYVIDTGDYLQLSDIGTSVQAYSSALQNTTASFTTADETKLDGIEAGADVTDTANVTAAGALMDSELTDIAAVKTLDQGVATSDSPTFAGGTFNGDLTINGSDTGALSIPPSDTDWLTSSTDGPWYLRANAKNLTMTNGDTRRYAIVGAAKTSASSGASEAIALGSAIINDGVSPNDGNGWGFIIEAQHETSTTYTFAQEIALKNASGVDVVSTPYSNPANTTRGILMAGGGDNSFGPVATDPCTVGITFSTTNSTGWNTGIEFRQNSIPGSEPEAISFANSHAMRWYEAAGGVSAVIKSVNNTADAKLTLQFQNGGLNLSNNSGNSAFLVATSPTAENRIQLAANEAGSAPQVSAAGTDTNIDLRLTPKGSGLVRLNGGATITGDTMLGGGVTETVYALSGTTPALDPSNGSIQTWTLTGNSAPTDSLSAGEAITLMIDDGTAYTINWATSMSVTWVNNGGSAPTLATTGYTVIALWKVSTTLYGALVGDGS
jgi:hypothetical protein